MRQYTPYKLTLSKAWLLLIGISYLLIGLSQASNFSYSGFVSQGLVYTTENNFYGDSQDGSFEYREIGLNGIWQPSSKLHVYGQLLSRKAGKKDDGEIRFDYLGIAYRALHDDSQTLDLRLGRYKNTFGLYNQTRDVAFTRPSIFLPQSIYLDRFRDLSLASDGLKLSYQRQSDDFRFVFDLGLGKPQITANDLLLSFAELDGSNSRLKDEQLHSAQFLAELNDGEWVASLGKVIGDIDVDVTLDIPLNFIFQDGRFKLDGTIASLQYNSEYYSITAEYFQVKSDVGIIIGGVPSNYSESYYLQAEYRYSPQLQFVIRSDSYYFNKDDKSGALHNFVTGDPAHTRFAKDLSLTARWQFDASWLAMLEYHQVDGTGWLSEKDNPDLFALQRKWSMITALVSYRF